MCYSPSTPRLFPHISHLRDAQIQALLSTTCHGRAGITPTPPLAGCNSRSLEVLGHETRWSSRVAAGAAGVRVSQPQLPFPVPKLALGTPAALPAPRGGGRRVSQRGPARITAMEIFRNPPHPLPGPSMTAEASRTAQPTSLGPPIPPQPGRFGLRELLKTSLVSPRARAPRGGASPSPLPARRCSAQTNAAEALAAGAAGAPACAWGPPPACAWPSTRSSLRP